MTRTEMPSIDAYVQAVLGKKAEDLIVLDVRNLTSYTDVFAQVVPAVRSSPSPSIFAKR